MLRDTVSNQTKTTSVQTKIISAIFVEHLKKSEEAPSSILEFKRKGNRKIVNFSIVRKLDFLIGLKTTERILQLGQDDSFQKGVDQLVAMNSALNVLNERNMFDKMRGVVLRRERAKLIVILKKKIGVSYASLQF